MLMERKEHDVEKVGAAAQKAEEAAEGENGEGAHSRGVVLNIVAMQR